MMDRWERSNKNIPDIDREDIINCSGRLEDQRQQHPEFTQASYLRLRSIEEAFSINNYLDPEYKQE